VAAGIAFEKNRCYAGYQARLYPMRLWGDGEPGSIKRLTESAQDRSRFGYRMV